MDNFIAKYKEWIPKLEKARKRFLDSFGEDFKELNRLEKQYKDDLINALYEENKGLDITDMDIEILEMIAKMEIFKRGFLND